MKVSQNLSATLMPVLCLGLLLGAMAWSGHIHRQAGVNAGSFGGNYFASNPLRYRAYLLDVQRRFVNRAQVKVDYWSQKDQESHGRNPVAHSQRLLWEKRYQTRRSFLEKYQHGSTHVFGSSLNTQTHSSS